MGQGQCIHAFPPHLLTHVPQESITAVMLFLLWGHHTGQRFLTFSGDRRGNRATLPQQTSPFETADNTCSVSQVLKVQPLPAMK